MKSQVPIDQLLAAAFMGGIPKESYDAMITNMRLSAFELGTIVDGGTSYEPRKVDELSADFQIIQNAVIALQGTYVQLDWDADGLFLLGSLWSRVRVREILNHGGCYVESGHLIDLHNVHAGMLVLTHAMNRNYPRWNFGEQLIPEQVRKGTPPRSKLVCPNGFGKLEEISPIEIARARFEYHVWWKALGDLLKSLPVLKKYEPLHPNADFAPWIIKKPASPYNTLILENFSTSQKTSLQAEGT